MSEHPYYADGDIPSKTEHFEDETTKEDASIPPPSNPKSTAPKFQDVFFAVLFLIHMLVMTIIGAIFGKLPWEIDGEYGNADHGMHIAVDFVSILKTGFVCSAFALVLSAHSMMFMAKAPLLSVQATLSFNVAVSLFLFGIGIARRVWPLIVIGLLVGVYSVFFVILVRKRVGFAASHLSVALYAYGMHLRLFLVSLLCLVVLCLSTLWWLYTAVGCLAAWSDCENGVCQRPINLFLLIVFILSYIWTYQIIKNVLHVTVARTIGIWCRNTPTKDDTDTNLVFTSLNQAVTTSFGSICVGSLVMASSQFIKKSYICLSRKQERNAQNCAISILNCIQGMLEYFNEWAYVYIAIYRCSFLEAGKKVTDLFRIRGWTTLLTEHIIANFLFVVSLVNGLLSGIFGLIIATVVPYYYNALNEYDAAVMAFFVGFATGFFTSRIVLDVPGSAVDTVIVCYAEAPDEFEKNHPHSFSEINDSWQEAWPFQIGYEI